MVERSLHVLVTGAAGHLGSHLAPALQAEGYAVSAIDRVSADALRVPVRCVDLNDAVGLRSVLEGVDLVVHCASIHPWKRYDDADYLRCNVQGAWALYTAIRQAGIRRVVLTSSIAAGGYGRIAPDSWPVSESMQFPLADLYSFTKHAQEDIARHFAETHGITTWALRPPAFMPVSDPLTQGGRLLGSYAVVDDMVSAHVAAVQALTELSASHQMSAMEVIHTTTALPYTPADAQEIGFQGDPLPLAQRYWPYATDWLVHHGYTPTWLAAVYDVRKAARLLNWRAACGFPEWFTQQTGRCPTTGEPLA